MTLPDLAGKTVLVIGNNKSADATIKADYVITASCSIKYAPKADMHICIDGVLPPPRVDKESAKAFKEFEGLRIIGVPTDNPNVLFHHMPHEIVKLSDTHTVEMRNNGISAIRVAAECGAKKIILSGFDMKVYDEENAAYGFGCGVSEKALDALIQELENKGVVVENKSGHRKTRQALSD
jgi:uncharacterized Rossmann fold enzyme